MGEEEEEDEAGRKRMGGEEVVAAMGRGGDEMGERKRLQGGFNTLPTNAC